MKTNGETKFSYFLVGLGLGAIGGLISAFSRAKTPGICFASAAQEALSI
jgi:hypothetical protein